MICWIILAEPGLEAGYFRVRTGDLTWSVGSQSAKQPADQANTSVILNNITRKEICFIYNTVHMGNQPNINLDQEKRRTS